MEITPISAHPRFSNTRIVGHKMHVIANAIKKDFSKIRSLSTQEYDQDVADQIKEIKTLILNNLEQVSALRSSAKNLPNEQWDDILYNALSRVHKHIDTPLFGELYNSLISIDHSDMTHSGVHFLQAYMRIVARVPEDKITLPFKP